jgi:hypothetical protein
VARLVVAHRAAVRHASPRPRADRRRTLSFPHRQPASTLPGAMDPAQAAQATELLRAERLVPIHYGGYDLPGIYEPVPDAAELLRAASQHASVLEPGEEVDA